MDESLENEPAAEVEAFMLESFEGGSDDNDDIGEEEEEYEEEEEENNPQPQDEFQQRKIFIPDTWQPSKKIGSVIEDCILPIKTPLSGRYSEGEQESFTWEDVYTEVNKMDKERKLVGVIDLNAQRSYYEREEVTSNGCVHAKFKKLQFNNHAETPRICFLLNFIRIIDALKRYYPNGLVAVHCIDGQNLTGYFVCTYLIHKGYTPEHALATFADSRPPGVYKRAYIDALYFAVYGPEVNASLISYPEENPAFNDPHSDLAIQREGKRDPGKHKAALKCYQTASASEYKQPAQSVIMDYGIDGSSEAKSSKKALRASLMAENQCVMKLRAPPPVKRTPFLSRKQIKRQLKSTRARAVKVLGGKSGGPFPREPAVTGQSAAPFVLPYAPKVPVSLGRVAPPLPLVPPRPRFPPPPIGGFKGPVFPPAPFKGFK
eukprot:TRINITY_DN10298_c0_g1_i1.p1 TRINITY_DN10298_c0_g1~~TRINITY_DN10298_c0_g1_i1.p1  ORF type:complete len:432 (+),score=55.88 TRINITY_DN10298_c0_g1_i1:892-2187(+)